MQVKFLTEAAKQTVVFSLWARTTMQFRAILQSKDKIENFVATLITGFNRPGPLQWGFLRQRQGQIFCGHPDQRI
jgi:hypothetical protein